MGTVIDSHFLALTAIVTVGYQLIFFIITALLKIDKVTDFAARSPSAEIRRTDAAPTTAEFRRPTKHRAAVHTPRRAVLPFKRRTVPCSYSAPFQSFQGRNEDVPFRSFDVAPRFDRRPLRTPTPNQRVPTSADVPTDVAPRSDRRRTVSLFRRRTVSPLRHQRRFTVPTPQLIIQDQGSTNFIIIGILTLTLKGAWHFRQIVVTLLVVLWGLRLALFLLMRILQWGEDRRFDEMRNNIGKLAVFWIFQAIWVWTVSLPVTVVNASDRYPFVQPQDIIGWIMWTVGVTIEATADQQKLIFKNSPDNRRKWCNIGLWKYSRHPNYFGESSCAIAACCIWTDALMVEGSISLRVSTLQSRLFNRWKVKLIFAK